MFTIVGATGNSLKAIEDVTGRHHHHQQQFSDWQHEEKGYCAPYNGKICKNYISGQVWYSREDPNGGWKNEQITTALWEELIADLTGQCRYAAEVNFLNIIAKLFLICFLYLCQKMLCAYAFPRCQVENGHTIKVPLCFEDCTATHLQYCYNDWVLIEEKKERNIFIKSRAHFRLPNCTILPKYNATAKKPNCSYIGLTEIIEDQVTCKCFVKFR